MVSSTSRPRHHPGLHTGRLARTAGSKGTLLLRGNNPSTCGRSQQPAMGMKKAPLCGAFHSAPERTRTSTDHSVHKALKAVAPQLRGPSAGTSRAGGRCAPRVGSTRRSHITLNRRAAAPTRRVLKGQLAHERSRPDEGTSHLLGPAGVGSLRPAGGARRSARGARRSAPQGREPRLSCAQGTCWSRTPGAALRESAWDPAVLEVGCRRD